MEISNHDYLLQVVSNKSADMFSQACAMHRLCASYGYTQASLAHKLAISQSSVGNKIRLLQYSLAERQSILSHNLSERHARTLLRIQPPRRAKLIETAGKLHLTVQKTEELVEKYEGDNSVLLSSQDVQELSAPVSFDNFLKQMQLSAERLSRLGYKVACLTENGDGYHRITVTVSEHGFT